MIQKLRRKFVGILMLTVTLILLGIFVTVLITTHSGIEKNSMDALHGALLSQDGFAKESKKTLPPSDETQNTQTPPADAAGKPDRVPTPVGEGGFPFAHQRTPILVIQIDANGAPRVARNQLHFVEEDDIAAIAQEVLAQADTAGVLKDYGLRFQTQTKDGNTRIALMDNTAEKEMLSQLLVNALLIGLGAELCFLILSILLSGWAVRPVAKVWAQQKQFVADASHELKTPLTVILSNTDMLRKNTTADAQDLRRMQYIHEESLRMKSLVEDLLTLAQTDAERPASNQTEVDFSFQVENGVLLFEPVIYESGKEIRSSILPGLRLMGDTGKLQQLISILLDNAQKYSPTGSTITVSLNRREKKHALLCVYNDGDPIPAAERAQIFTRFYRRDKARVSSGGFGLGLSIAQNITLAHKGKIWVESDMAGNTFCVQLPLL